ncbi:MFS transporter, partial [Rhodococcus hoagii]|nr:MFS transporter [Prescottella equi]
ITAAARAAFLDGDSRAYVAAIVIVLVGAALVFFAYPRRDGERELLERYREIDRAAAERAESRS